MGQPTVNVGVVDIGTNSIRLLITDGNEDLARREVVTGLGRGVDASGLLSPAGIAETLPVLEDYRRLMDGHQVGPRAAIATSASRDASNREEFFDQAEELVGVRPRLISGEAEARYAYVGATSRSPLPGPHLVCDIGGGSTELVTEGSQLSIDIGSVRVTERWLRSRPVSLNALDEVRRLVKNELDRAGRFPGHTLIGVAGTWNELPGLAHGTKEATTVTLTQLTSVVDRLAGLSIEETRELPTLNPARAGVILGGAIVAEAVMELAEVGTAQVSIRDSLDGVAIELIALA